MTVYTEGLHTAEFLLSEGNGTISREEVTFAAAAPAMVPGEIVGKITASGKYTKYNNANADGSEVAAGILYAALADKAVDQKGVIITRNAEVQRSVLTGLDAPGEVDLNARNVIIR